MLIQKNFNIYFYASVLGFFICLMIATPAFSQGGSQIESLKIPVQKKAATGMSAAELLKQMEAASHPADSKPVVVEEPPQKEVEPTIAPVKKKTQAVIKQKKYEPVKKAEKKKVVPSKKEKKKAVTKTVKRTYLSSDLPPPLPNLKPNTPTQSSKAQARIINYNDVPNDIVMTRDIALRIALEYAPPARSFTVFEGRDYKGRIVYQVTFKTEGGPHDILVDAQNGKVLKR